MMGRQSGQISMVILDIAELIPRDHLLGKSIRWFRLTLSMIL